MPRSGLAKSSTVVGFSQRVASTQCVNLPREQHWEQLVEAGARVAAGGTFENLYYQPTVLAEVTPEMPAYKNEIFGPVAPVVRFSTLDEAAELARGTEYGLSLAILTRDVMQGMALAELIPSGIVHINDQTINDEAVAPKGGVGSSGTGSRLGGAQWNRDAFTETQWVTMRGDIAPYPW
ncbi:MAG TPA: aldehyde dehydrogenase family protein [Ktedonobacteraceae bacterium]|nr:aldehyde dehydrogenase family protein [Ktedonobacteraceae bacterium]